jgi:hypothetical protein
VLTACLSTRPHYTVDLDDSLEGADEYSLELFQTRRNGVLAIPGDENTAVYRLLEGRLPGRVRLRSGDHAWVSKTLFLERG